MKGFLKLLACLFIYLSVGMSGAVANTTANQTDDLSPILPGAALPFRIVIEQANFQLPVGLHSGVFGVYQGLWVFIAGRANGLHGFGPDPFPTDKQNTSIYVVNPVTGVTSSRALNDPSSGLSQQQIDTLSVTSPQAYQEGNTLYITGGYGINTGLGTFETKPVLTAVYLPGIVQWVREPGNSSLSVAANIRQVYDSTFQISGGEMFKLGDMTQLIFGQNFSGVYTDTSNGSYSQQVRQFQIRNANGQLAADISTPKPQIPNPNFRRRDLNVVPAVLNNNNDNLLQYGFIAYSGVFTTDTGVWTVPVIIDQTGNPTMADPSLPTTFKQGMNQYVCATAGLYSRRHGSMYNIFFGGISYGFYSNGVFTTDAEIPFLNQVTTIKRDRNGNMTQYLMDSEYPVIVSTGSNPGNTLLFGAGAYFIPNSGIHQYPNTVINLDSLRGATVIGYIVGGIQSTVPNTTTQFDTSASPLVFKVTVVPTAV